MGDIDQFPTFDILKGIIATYMEKKYDWSKIKLDTVYFFPVWSDIVDNNNVYDYLREEIGPLLEKNKNVCDYQIDYPDLATPNSQMKRLMWFTCGDKEYANKIRESINEMLFNEFTTR